MRLPFLRLLQRKTPATPGDTQCSGYGAAAGHLPGTPPARQRSGQVARLGVDMEDTTMGAKSVDRVNLEQDVILPCSIRFAFTPAAPWLTAPTRAGPLAAWCSMNMDGVGQGGEGDGELSHLNKAGGPRRSRPPSVMCTTVIHLVIASSRAQLMVARGMFFQDRYRSTAVQRGCVMAALHGSSPIPSVVRLRPVKAVPQQAASVAWLPGTPSFHPARNRRGDSKSAQRGRPSAPSAQ